MFQLVFNYTVFYTISAKRSAEAEILVVVNNSIYQITNECWLYTNKQFQKNRLRIYLSLKNQLFGTYIDSM